MKGSMNGVFLNTAVIISGHEKVVTRAYKEESQMLPNDLALLDANQIIKQLNEEYPDYFWTPIGNQSNFLIDLYVLPL